MNIKWSVGDVQGLPNLIILILIFSQNAFRKLMRTHNIKERHWKYSQAFISYEKLIAMKKNSE